MIITFDQFLKNVHVLERIVRCKVFPNFHLERAINKGELHLKIWSIRIKMSKFQKHHDRIPKHVFHQLVKSFFKFPYVLRKKWTLEKGREISLNVYTRLPWNFIQGYLCQWCVLWIWEAHRDMLLLHNFIIYIILLIYMRLWEYIPLNFLFCRYILLHFWFVIIPKGPKKEHSFVWKTNQRKKPVSKGNGSLRRWRCFEGKSCSWLSNLTPDLDQKCKMKANMTTIYWIKLMRSQHRQGNWRKLI